MSKLHLRQQILQLKFGAKTVKEIAKILDCCENTVRYHLNPEKHKKQCNIRGRRYRYSHPYIRKIQSFKHRRKSTRIKIGYSTSLKWRLHAKVNDFIMSNKNKQSNIKSFTIHDVINKLGENPTCYLTGQLIDIFQPETYQFDHIIPVSKGGDNSLENLGICTKEANQAKRDMTPSQFLELCKSILEYNGYEVKPRKKVDVAESAPAS